MNKSLKKLFSLALALALVFSSGLGVGTLDVQAAEANTFTDVKAGHDFYDYVTYLAEKDITTGYTTGEKAGTFGVNETLTRNNAAVFLIRALGTELGTYKGKFADVKQGTSGALYIEAAAELGLVKGYPNADGTKDFRPQATVTRGQFAKMVALAYELKADVNKTLTMTDLAGNTEVAYIKAVIDHGVVDGYPNNTYRPNNGVTRGHVSKFIYKAEHLVPEAVVEVAELEAVKTTIAQQVGKDAEVEYKVLDQKGNPIANREIYFRIGQYNDNIAYPAVEKTAISDANGVVKFSYSRNDEIGTPGETATAYVVGQPLVRNTDVRVMWTIAPTGLIDVEASHSGRVGHNTVLEYKITARDLDSVALDRGEEIELELEEKNNATPKKVQIQRTNGTWEDVAVASPYVIKLKEKGKANVRVIYENQSAGDENKSFEVTPKFQFDSNDDGSVDEKDAIAIAPRVTFVKQNPTLTMTPENNQNNVEVNGKKQYTLKVSDQFGDPFRGVVTVGALEVLDGMSSTEGPAGTLTISADTDGNEVFDLVDASTIDFEFGAEDANNDSEVTLTFSNSAAGSLTPVAFYDADGNGFVGAKDPQAKGEKITFGQVAPTTIKLDTETETGAVGGTVKFDLSFLDVNAKLFEPGTDIVLNLVELGTTNVAEAGSTITVKDAGGNTVGATSTNQYVISAAALKSKLSVEVTPTKGAKNYKLTAYADGNGDEVQQLDEVSASKEFTLVTAEITKGKITSDADYGLSKGAFNAAKIADDSDVTYTYTLQNQSGVTINAPTGGARVNWVVTNNSDGNITVAGNILAKNKSVTVSKTISAGASTDTLIVKSANEALVDVQAQVVGIGTTVQETTTYFYEAANLVNSETAEVTYSGTVKAFNNNPTGVSPNFKTDGTTFVLETPVGNIVVNTVDLKGDGSTLPAAAELAFMVKGNTATEATFEKALELGKTVKVVGDGTGLVISID